MLSFIEPESTLNQPQPRGSKFVVSYRGWQGAEGYLSNFTW